MITTRPFYPAAIVANHAMAAAADTAETRRAPDLHVTASSHER